MPAQLYKPKKQCYETKQCVGRSYRSWEQCQRMVKVLLPEDKKSVFKDKNGREVEFIAPAKPIEVPVCHMHKTQWSGYWFTPTALDETSEIDLSEPRIVMPISSYTPLHTLRSIANGMAVANRGTVTNAPAEGRRIRVTFD